VTDLSLRLAALTGRQARSFPARYEVRGLSGNKVSVRGYASTTEQPYKMHDAFGTYTEVVRSGAFTATLAAGADVAYLANHSGLTLARTTSGTLHLAEDSQGLEAVATLNTSRGDARDLVTAIEDGDVDQMSFGFRVDQQSWTPDSTQRSLLAVDLHRGDVSAVNFGANAATSIGVHRSQPAAGRLARLLELRDGKMLSAATTSTLTKVLELLATADTAVDAAQPLLADLLGVPNPDDDQGDPAGADPARALNRFLLCR